MAASAVAKVAEVREITRSAGEVLAVSWSGLDRIIRIRVSQENYLKCGLYCKFVLGTLGSCLQVAGKCSKVLLCVKKCSKGARKCWQATASCW